MAGTDGELWLQDYRDFYAWHGTGKGKLCNVLMADGSVRSFRDLNGDGFLNPGFLITTENSTAGYQDGTIEFFPDEIYSGPWIREPIKKTEPRRRTGKLIATPGDDFADLCRIRRPKTPSSAAVHF